MHCSRKTGERKRGRETVDDRGKGKSRARAGRKKSGSAHSTHWLFTFTAAVPLTVWECKHSPPAPAPDTKLNAAQTALAHGWMLSRQHLKGTVPLFFFYIYLQACILYICQPQRDVHVLCLCCDRVIWKKKYFKDSTKNRLHFKTFILLYALFMPKVKGYGVSHGVSIFDAKSTQLIFIS